MARNIRQAENQQREIKKQALPSLPKLYVAVLSMTMRSWSRPVEKVARDVLTPMVGELPAFYKATTTLTAAGALAALSNGKSQNRND